ncbi:hypothetical protein MBLNU230_g1903t1 [Neophaeotheca triangularis]
MALRPDPSSKIDRTQQSPFLLRVFHRSSALFAPSEFSVAPPEDTTDVPDYTALLPASLRSHSVHIYTWPDCTLGELVQLLSSQVKNMLPTPAVGTRVVFKLVFPDTRSAPDAGGKGRWLDKPLGHVVVGGVGAELPATDADGDAATATVDLKDLEGDAGKSLAEARFVIGDYIVCSVYPPGADGRVAPVPAARGGAPPGPGGGRSYPGGMRENGYGRGGFGGPGGYGGGRSGFGSGSRGGYGGAPSGAWNRGERPPAGPAAGGYGGGGYGARSGRGGGRPF